MRAEQRWCSAAPGFPPWAGKEGEGWIYLSLHQEAMQEPGWAERSMGPNSPCPLTRAQGTPDPLQTWLWRTGRVPKDRDF